MESLIKERIVELKRQVKKFEKLLYGGTGRRSIIYYMTAIKEKKTRISELRWVLKILTYDA